MIIQVNAHGSFKYESKEHGCEYEIRAVNGQITKLKGQHGEPFEPSLGIPHLGDLKGVKQIFMEETHPAFTFEVSDAPLGDFTIKGEILINTANEPGKEFSYI